MAEVPGTLLPASRAATGLLSGPKREKKREKAKQYIKNVVVNVTFDQLTVTEQKIWEVFFDHKEEGSDKGHRIDPLILDLNKDGKFDITGANQEGNGKLQERPYEDGRLEEARFDFAVLETSGSP